MRTVQLKLRSVDHAQEMNCHFSSHLEYANEPKPCRKMRAVQSKLRSVKCSQENIAILATILNMQMSQIYIIFMGDPSRAS